MILCDHLLEMADRLDRVEPLPANYEEEVHPEWESSQKEALRLSYIWEVDPNEELIGEDERLEGVISLSEEDVTHWVDEVSNACLELSQHISFNLEMIQEEERTEASKCTPDLARRIANMPQNKESVQDIHLIAFKNFSEDSDS